MLLLFPCPFSSLRSGHFTLILLLDRASRILSENQCRKSQHHRWKSQNIKCDQWWKASVENLGQC